MTQLHIVNTTSHMCYLYFNILVAAELFFGTCEGLSQRPGLVVSHHRAESDMLDVSMFPCLHCCVGVLFSDACGYNRCV